MKFQTYLTFLTTAAALAACSSSPVPEVRDGAVVTPTDSSRRDVRVNTGPPPAGTLLWYEDITPITYAKCGGCHREGGIAPFSMFHEGDVLAYADEMKGKTSRREMPPMPVNNDGSCASYANARWLTTDEIAKIGRWVDMGKYLGNDLAAAPMPPAPTGLVDVNKTFDIGVDYLPTPPAGGTDDYRCFVVDPEIATTAYLTGYELIPGNTTMVHHAIVYAPNDAGEVAAAEALDARDEIAGYTCFGGPTIDALPIALWAPGGAATNFPANTGIQLVARRKLVVQIHYHIPGHAGHKHAHGTDRTSVKFLTVPTVAKQAYFSPVVNLGLSLPPGLEYAESSHTTEVLPVGITLYGVAPHMHTLGKTMHVTTTVGSNTQCIVDVDRWNFRWQGLWWYSTPIVFGPNARSMITCGYDTRSRTETVRWGERTTDEMCIAYFYVTLP